MSRTGKFLGVLPRGKMAYEQDGKARQHSASFYRGEHTHFHPRDVSLRLPTFIPDYVMQGLAPAEPFLGRDDRVVAFGSCFAYHLSNYLFERGFNVSTRQKNVAYITRMGDGIVNTHAIRQQFEWAWQGREPSQDLWHGYDKVALGYDEDVRLATRALFDEAHTFVITLGLSEVWYDEPTGEVFWRAVPMDAFDPARHKFRVSGFAENLDNLRAIHAMIRQRRPDARIVFTLSPIPLTATFRPIPCIVADAESKAILRTALGELMRTTDDPRLHYFPSYEIVTRTFNHPYINDRTHVHAHVADLNMAIFERYYCTTGMTDAELFDRWRGAADLDAAIGREGHEAAPDANFKDQKRHHAASEPAD
jgi:hypothetical protein